MYKINVLIEGDKNSPEFKKTKDSIIALTKTTKNKIVINSKDESDFIIPMIEGSTLTDMYFSAIEEKISPETLILPLVLLTHNETKGILNGCLWNLALTSTPGELDFELSKKQIDLTLYGALIPNNWFYDKENYKDDLKIYQHFYFLNMLTRHEKKIGELKVTLEPKNVIGVPKILVLLDADLTYSDYSNEDKIKYFNMAKEV